MEKNACKILKEIGFNMNERAKYPRTFHLPWSEGRTDDDKVLSDDSQFIGKDVVVTEKMDGENTTIYSDGYFHARSIDGTSNPWQSWLYAHICSKCYALPEGWRICGENLYAKHSISYDGCWPSLESLFQVFGIYDADGVCISWNETKEICWKLKLCHVPEIYIGPYNRDLIQLHFNNYKARKQREVEGYVVRVSGFFPAADFKNNVAKFVRAHHVQTNEHWTKHWEKTKLA